MKRTLNLTKTIALITIAILFFACKKPNPMAGQSILLTLQNNTPANQNVVLFDSVGALNSENALQDDTLYQWDFTGLFGTGNTIKVIATPADGSATTYTYINPSGTINNITDLVNGLNTLGLGTFYNLSGNILAVNRGSSSFSYTSVQILNTVQFDWTFTLLTLKSITITGVGVTGTIDWGDGATSVITGGDTHTYAVAGTYNVTMEYEGVLQILNPVGNMTYFNPTIALPSTLTGLVISGDDLASFNPTIALPLSLQVLDLSQNFITSFVPTITLPSGLQSLNLNNNSLGTSQVNATLIYLNNIGYSVLVSNLQQFIPAPPSGAGITAKNALVLRGCTITTD